VDLRTGERLPDSFLAPEPFDWGVVGGVLKGLVYFALLCVVIYYGWKLYKEKGIKGMSTIFPVEGPATPGSQTPKPETPKPQTPAAVPVQPKRPAVPSVQMDDIAAALVLAASPGESSNGANQLAALLRKDWSVASRVLEDRDPMVRIALAKALGMISNDKAASLIFTLMADDDKRVADAASMESERLKRELLLVEAGKAINNPKAEVRRGAVGILTRLKAKDKALEISKLMDDPDPGVVIRAIDYFRNVTTEPAVYRKMLKLAAETNDPAIGSILGEVIYFRTDDNTEDQLLGEIGRFPRERFFMLVPAVAKLKSGRSGTALKERVQAGLSGLPDEFRQHMLATLYGVSPEIRRTTYMELFLNYPRPGGYGDIALLWLRSPNSDSNQVTAASLLSWRTSAAPFALATCLSEEKPFTAITMALALSRQEKGAVLAAVDKLLQSGDAQEKALASAAAYLAGRSEATEGCRKAVLDGRVNETVAAFLRALLAESGDVESVKYIRNAIQKEHGGGLPMLFARIGLVLVGEPGAAEKLMEETRNTRPVGADLFAGFFLLRSAAAGHEEVLTPLLSIYTTDNFYTGIFIGAMLALEKPKGLPQALKPLLATLSPRMTNAAALAFKPYGDEIVDMLIDVMGKGTPAERINATYQLADLGANNEKVRIAVADMMKANRENNAFLTDTRPLAQKMVGRDVGTDWQEWYKVLAPEKYNVEDEPLVKTTVNGQIALMVPKNWQEQAGRYVTDRMPGEPVIRTSIREDANPVITSRQFPNAQQMLIITSQRYTIDMLTRQKVKGVVVEASKGFNKGAFAVQYTAITEPDGKGRLLACGLMHTAQKAIYIEVEGECAVKYFQKYRPLFQKVIESVELLTPGT
jgi:hypothetical protein